MELTLTAMELTMRSMLRTTKPMAMLTLRLANWPMKIRMPLMSTTAASTIKTVTVLLIFRIWMTTTTGFSTRLNHHLPSVHSLQVMAQSIRAANSRLPMAWFRSSKLLVAAIVMAMVMMMISSSMKDLILSPRDYNFSGIRERQICSLWI